jgi:hypothetical protein
VRLPRPSLVRQFDTHRLVPSKYLPRGDSVLTRIADNVEHLRDIFELDAATNDRLLAEAGRLPGIGPHELVFDVPGHTVINAAFCHARPLGARFSGPDRGAWYAAFAIETAQAEVSFHKSVELAEVDWWHEETTYTDYLADFSAEFHDLRRTRAFRRCLSPDSYVASQELAERLFESGSLGVVYPSVRHNSGTCIACFRPALVMNVRRDATWRFTWDGTPRPTVTRGAT